jgi:flavin-dependent dehydrogenase
VYLRKDAYDRGERTLKKLLAAFVERHRDRFANATAVGRPRTWSLPIAPRAMPLGGPGLLLVGDAAGLVDPLSGEGIWQGLHSGVVAAEITGRALEHGDLSEDAVDRYETRIRTDIVRPSRAKAAVQRAMTEIVDRRLYRFGVVRATLSWGYRRGVLEMTKS